MVRNRNGYWMSPKFFMSASAEGGGGGESGTGLEGGTPSETPAEEGTKAPEASNSEPKKSDSADAQIAKLQAEIARQKEAISKATKEAADYKRELRARQTQEEIDAANKKEEQEKRDQEFADLQKEVARARSAKSVMSKLGVDENVAGQISECLMGCEDIDNALLLIQQAWEAREKALKIQYGKIPPPGAGGGSEDREMQEALKFAKELGRQKAGNRQSVREQLQGLIR